MSEMKINSEASSFDFVGGKWQNEINVRSFIQKNYTPYYGDSRFLAGPTEATLKLWDNCCELFKKERENGGVLDLDTKIVSSITSHGAGYIDKELETIVGLQTDAPLKRSLQRAGRAQQDSPKTRKRKEYTYKDGRQNFLMGLPW